MKDEDKPKDQLINELVELRRRMADRDVLETECRQLKEALKEREKKLRGFVERSSDMFFRIDNQGTITYVSPAAERILHFKPEEMVGRLFNDYLAESEIPRVSQHFAKGLKGEDVGILQVEVVRKDRSRGFVELTSTFVAKNGEATGTEGFIRDVSHRGEMEKELLREQKMDAIGVLTGGIAHKFNNLLQAVLGFAEVLLWDKQEDEPGYLELSQIVGAAKQGRELVKGLLTFSNKVERERQAVDLNSEIESVKSLLDQRMPETIEVELQLAADLQIVKANPAQIREIVLNLASNAKDAMPQGGRLCIETANVTLDGDFCKTYVGAKLGDCVLLTLSDTGCGMDEKALEHAFEPFYTTKGLAEATGLGLSTVYGIVKSHGGVIVCSSTPGEGTRFRIFLPVDERKAESGRGEPAVILGMPVKRREHILLPGYEERFQEVSQELLGKLHVLRDSCKGLLQIGQNGQNRPWFRGAFVMLQEAIDNFQTMLPATERDNCYRKKC